MHEAPFYDGPALILKTNDHHPYCLRPKGKLTIGRSNINDVILKDPSVSRQHASLLWDSKFPRIVDNKSTAGLQVDGDYISYRHLNSLHTIIIGSTIIQAELVRTEAECPTEVTNLTLKNYGALLKELDESDDVTLFGEAGSKDIVGYLSDNKAIQKLLVHLEMSRRTGTLTITEGTLTGVVIYGLGKIRGAICANRTGYGALQAICTFGRGSYHFSINVNVGEYGLNVSPMFYLRRFSKQITRRRPRFNQENDLVNSKDELLDD